MIALNWQEILRGQTNEVIFNQYTETELVTYWKDTWVYPRLGNLQAKLKERFD